jgi:hypothetical protein
MMDVHLSNVLDFVSTYLMLDNIFTLGDKSIDNWKPKATMEIHDSLQGPCLLGQTSKKNTIDVVRLQNLSTLKKIPKKQLSF